jgi:WD40 repeat protein
LAELISDMRNRYARGERVLVESYLSKHPNLKEKRETVLDLAYNEFLMRRSAGEKPSLAEYQSRFPTLADALRMQFEVDAFLKSESEIDSRRDDSTQNGPVPAGADTISQGPSAEGGAAPAPHRSIHMAGYEVIRELGRGGMGVVYLARHLKLGNQVALKMILAGGHASESDLARFELEAAAVARIKHPGIIHIHEFGEFEGKPFFSLEFVEGGSLAGLLKDGPMTPRDAATMVEKLARAMHHAHEAGIVHRDLKPANVLLTKQGEPKVADFGLAKDIGSDDGLSRSGAIMGTPSYMAPEQAEGRLRDIGPTTDVYALGAILYQCLTGSVPFRGTTLHETLLMVATQPPPSLRSTKPGVSRDLETICLRCLEKNPKGRYATAAELADDLGRFLRGEPVRARPVGWFERSWRWCRRNPAAVTVALALLVGAVVSTVFGIQSSIDAREADKAREKADEKTKLEVAARIREKAASDNETAALKARAEALEERAKAVEKTRASLVTAQLARVDASLQKSNVAQSLLHDEDAIPKSERDFAWGLYNAWTRQTSRELVPTSRSLRTLSLSPDGKQVAMGSVDGTLAIRSSEKSGPGQTTINCESGVLLASAFSPDGKFVATSGSNGQVRIWNLGDLRTPRICKNNGLPVKRLSFSDDGRLLAGADGTVFIQLWDTATGDRRALSTDETGDYSSIAVLSSTGDLVATTGKVHDIYVLKTKKYEEVAILDRTHGKQVQAVAFSPDEKGLASGDAEGLLVIWDLTTEKAKHKLEGHGSPIRGVAYTPDGKSLVSADESGVIKIWDATSGKETKSLRPDVLTLEKIELFSLSKDGSRLAVSDGGAARIWDLATGASLTTTVSRPSGNFGVAYSPDGNLLAVAGMDGTVRLWDPRSAKMIRELTGHGRPVTGVAFSPDGASLASVGQDGMLRLWDAKSGDAKFVKPVGKSQDIVFSPDGKTILGWSPEDLVRMFDSGTGQPLPLPPDANRFVARAARFVGDGKHLAMVSELEPLAIYVIDVASGKVKGHIRETEFFSGIFAFSPDGTKLVAGLGNRFGKSEKEIQHKVKLYELNAQFGVTKSQVLVDQAHLVVQIDFSPDGSYVGAGSIISRHVSTTKKESGELRVWDAKKGSQVSQIRENATLTGFAFARDNALATCGYGAGAKVWDRRTGVDGSVLLAEHKEEITAVAVSPDSSLVASASMDGSVKLWDAATGLSRQTFVGQGQIAANLAFHPDGKSLLAIRTDGIRIWNVESGKETHVISGVVEVMPPMSSGFVCVAFSKDGKTVAISGMDRTDRKIKLLDATEWKLRTTTKAHPSAIRALAFDPDDSAMLASSCDDGTIRLWDAFSGAEKKSFGEPETKPGILRFAGKDRVTVHHLETTRHELREWTIANGESSGRLPLVAFEGAQSQTRMAIFKANDRCFSSDGRIVASVLGERTVTLFETRFGQQRASFVAEPSGVLAITISPKGDLLVTGGRDGSVRLWRAQFD